jgi:pimeloyl-ACP methyl ester carboxylesterase
MTEALALAKNKAFKLKDGITLVGDCWGDPANPPVILAHGGGQTRHAWGETAKRLAEKGWYAINLDQRGHGDSSWCDSGNYMIMDYGRDLQQVCSTLSQKPVMIGASLGGLAGIMAEGTLDESIFRALILVDVTPRIEKEGVDKILGFMSQNVEAGFASLDEAANAIAAYLPHRKRPKNLDGLSKNLRLGVDGRYRWHWDPKFMTNRQMPESAVDDNPMVDAAKTLAIPTLLVRGKLSELVSKESAQQLKELVPHSEFVDVSDAGHMVAGDKNDIFTEAILGFMAKL